MEKVYKMPGYDLHLLPTNKFKNITISLKLQNTLDEKTVAKRTLLSFMLTTGTEKYPSTQELSIYLESMYGMKLGANVVTKGKSHIININSICINQEYLPYKEDLIQRQIQLLNDIFFKPNASKTVFDQTMFERKKKELVEAKNQAESLVHATEKTLKEHGDKVSAAEKSKIEDELKALKTAIEAEDLSVIKEKTESLMQASLKLGEAMYKSQADASAAAGAQPGADAGASADQPAGDDKVVDADFEEVK